jgi:lysophospholipase L1-like esterase
MFSLVILFGCSDKGGNDDKTYKKVEINENSIILCIGNSLTDGYGTKKEYPYVDRSKSYPTILASKVNISVENKGVSGITVSEAATTVKSGAYDDYLQRSAVIIVELSANDLFNQIENALWGDEIDRDFVKDVEKSFEIILDRIKEKSVNPQIYLAKFYNKTIANELLKGSVWGFSYDYMFVYDDYENMFKRLAKKYNADVIGNIWDGIWGNTDYMFDEHDDGLDKYYDVHPNAKGYEIMANNYFKSMKGFLEYNDLTK